ncbi:hypothetical protein NQD34_008673 [Periophthalmus magnuspinnatus]|nr:hypothetical protein NQD34_008673 [Periophthalmus magnuspinnatus]
MMLNQVANLQISGQTLPNELLLPWFSPGLVLFWLWLSSGSVMVQSRLSTGSVLAQYWLRTGLTTEMAHSCSVLDTRGWTGCRCVQDICNLSILVQSWFSPGSVLVLSWFCPGSVLVLSWFCPGLALFYSRFSPGHISPSLWFSSSYPHWLFWNFLFFYFFGHCPLIWLSSVDS